MDALKLNYKSKDQLHPLLSDLMTSLNTSMPKDFEARGKIVQWLIMLNQMRAADELNEDQSRQVQTDCLCGADGRFCLILRRHIISFSMRLGSSMACIGYSFIPPPYKICTIYSRDPTIVPSVSRITHHNSAFRGTPFYGYWTNDEAGI
jgi:VPS28 protein